MKDIGNYIRYRNDFKTGDCVQWKTSSALGWLIRLFSGGEVNHTSLIVNISGYDGLVNRKFLLEARGSGVVLTSMSRRLYDHKGTAYVLPLKDEFDDKRVNIGNWAFLQVGVKYDYDSLFNQILGKVSVDAESYFCSEFAYLAWKNADIPMNNPDGLAPRPGDIDSLGIFKDPIIL